MEPYREPSPPAKPRQSGAVAWLLGGTGVFLWMAIVLVVLGIGGFVAMILLYATLHAPPHSASPAAPDASALE